MAAVHHLGFVMTSSYCIRKWHFMFPTLCEIFTAFSCVISENILYFMFQHFGLKLPIMGLILTIFGEKIGKNVKIKYSNPKRHILDAKHVYKV